MKFGVLLSAQHHRGGDLALRAKEHAEQARTMEALGYDSVWVGQHFLSDYQELQPIPTLSWLAAQTARLLIGTGVLLLPLYHAVAVAEELATLDVVSNGRLIAGFGLGYRDVEFETFGVPRAQAPARLSEGIEVVRRLWTEERVDFQGTFYRLQHASVSPRPVQRPRPPIWLAANTDRAIRRAAALADAWLINPHATLPVLTRQLTLYREEAAHSGKQMESIEVPLMREVYVAPSLRQAQADAFPALAAKYDRYVVWGQERAMGASGRLSLPVEDLARDRFIIGDPAYCIDEIHRYRQHLGVTHLILRSQWPGLPHELTIRSLRLFGERVIPAFT